MKLKLSRSQQQQQELRRRQQEEQGAEPEEYAVVPSEIPALRPGQRDPIYHQTQYRVYQPPDPPPLPPARSVGSRDRPGRGPGVGRAAGPAGVIREPCEAVPGQICFNNGLVKPSNVI